MPPVLQGLLARQRGHLFPWVPVCLALGIGGYFALPVEPGAMALAATALAGLGALALGLRGPEGGRPLGLAAALVALGLLAAALRTASVAAPVLPFPYYGPIEGRVVLVDRSGADKPRITLDRVRLERVAEADLPRRVRLTLAGATAPPGVEPGRLVRLTGFLGPPQGPAEPGGFDFQRHAWFTGLGAIGYARAPPELLPGPPPQGLAMDRLRQHIADGLRARIGGDAGGFVAAIATNDVSGLSPAALAVLRVANLAHVLSISGLHMALVTGFVFALLRYGLALVPPVALRLPVKKIAAVVALAVAAFYLRLSGMEVATTRSFLMISVVLGAVLLDRRAISLRSVAMSATLILLVTPEALVQASFQMSYAATVALIAGFGAAVRLWPGVWPPRGLAAPVLGLAAASLVAGLATAPFGLAYFGRMSSFGLLANLLAMPVMDLLLMPGLVVAALLAPLGLAGPVLWLLGLGARWVLAVAGWVAALPGASVHLAAPPAGTLGLLALGFLWLAIWQGRGRLAGLPVMALAALLWALADRPALLIADTGGLVGLATPQGRALSKPVGGFLAHAWLQADGDPAGVDAAAARPGFSGPRTARRFTLGATAGVVLTGKGAAAALPAACAEAGLVVLAARLAVPPPPGCRVIDTRLLRRTGALALWPAADGFRVVATRAVQGDRPWSRAGLRYPLRVPRLPPLPAAPDAGAQIAQLDRGAADQ